MGTWGLGNFENDIAMDLVAEISDSPNGATILVSSIQATANTPVSEFLDVEDAMETLVAIEFLSAQKGNLAEDFPEEGAQWLEENDLLDGDSFIGGTREEKGSFLVELSLKAIDRIIGANSELREVWEDSDDYDEWLISLDDLKVRLISH